MYFYPSLSSYNYCPASQVGQHAGMVGQHHRNLHFSEKAIISTKIYTNDSTYISESSNYFIGKTEKYYFIYNKDKKSSLVIPEREVSKFELHS